MDAVAAAERSNVTPGPALPLRRVYVFAGTCAAFAVLYGVLGVSPSPAMALLLGTGPTFAVAVWIANDARRTVGVFDASFFLYATWPVAIVWYAFHTRGSSGWRLVLKLYAVAICGMAGFVAGGILRVVLTALGFC